MTHWEDRIGRRIRIRDVHIAMMVAEAGSMLRASHSLAISQPVVSKAIADLEHTLGSRLFDRSRRGVELTAAGRVFLHRSQAAFDEFKQGVNEIEFLNDPTIGEVRIGASIALAEGLALSAIERFSEKYPRVVFKITQGGAMAILEELRERRIDVGFLRMIGSMSERDIDYEPLFEEPLIIAASKDHPLTRRRNVALADLIKERWTWPPPGTFIDSLVVDAFVAKGLQPPRPTVYVEPINIRVRLAATGRFLAIIPSYILRVASYRELIKALPVELPTTSRWVGMATLKNRTLSPIARVFLNCVKGVAQPASKRSKR